MPVASEPPWLCRFTLQPTMSPEARRPVILDKTLYKNGRRPIRSRTIAYKKADAIFKKPIKNNELRGFFRINIVLIAFFEFNVSKAIRVDNCYGRRKSHLQHPNSRHQEVLLVTTSVESKALLVSKPS